MPDEGMPEGAVAPTEAERRSDTGRAPPTPLPHASPVPARC